MNGSDNIQSLCETCSLMREIVTPKGSRFVLCELSKTNTAFPKYLPQPKLRCDGYQAKDKSWMLEDSSSVNLDSTIERTLAYHQRTKHHLRRYARSPGYVDWATQPDPFRT